MFATGCLLDAYATAERQMRHGWIPKSARPWYCAALGLAFYKPNNSLRTLNVRNVWLRHSGRCYLNEHCRDHASLFLRLGQTAIGVPGASETISHGLRLLWERNNDKVGASYDGRNAFGAMNRTLILKGLLKHVPDLAPFFKACYSPGALMFFFNDDTLSSDEGVGQGDTFALFYYCIGQGVVTY